MMQEQILEFDCQGDRLLGVLAEGAEYSDIGVLIVVGGPQYRIGSHRQFVSLARALAMAGFPCLRFDHRGIGDSEGEPRSFEALNDDIASAIDALQAARRDLRRIVLWGLCDAASAILIYWGATRDTRVAGLVLANPWVRSEQTQADALIKHYYRQRLGDSAFWWKLASGRLSLFGALGEYMRKRRLAMCAAGEQRGFQVLVRDALVAFSQPILLIMSGRDYTANEFDSWLAQPAQRPLQRCQHWQRVELPAADHTFASSADSLAVSEATCSWLRRLDHSCSGR
jgi:exosortase A-associated hydrolase 1